MIADLSDLFLLHFKELTEPANRIVKESISHGISIKGRIIEIADESEFLSDPLNLLRIFKMAQDNHCEFSSKALRMVRKRDTDNGCSQGQEGNWHYFFGHFTSLSGVAQATEADA